MSDVPGRNEGNKMPDTPKNPADDEAMKRAWRKWLVRERWAFEITERGTFEAGWRAAMAVRSRPDGVVAEMTKEAHGPIQRDGLYCVYGKCRGFPNSQFECHPGCSFTMSTKAPWEADAND